MTRRLASVLGCLTLLSCAPPRPAEAQIAFAPTVSSFNNGVTLNATPVVSADRRYVRLSLNPQFNALEGFDPYLVPLAVSGGGNGGGAGGILGALGGGNRGGLARLNAPAGPNRRANPVAAPLSIAKGPAIDPNPLPPPRPEAPAKPKLARRDPPSPRVAAGKGTARGRGR